MSGKTQVNAKIAVFHLYIRFAGLACVAFTANDFLDGKAIDVMMSVLCSGQTTTSWKRFTLVMS